MAGGSRGSPLSAAAVQVRGCIQQPNRKSPGRKLPMNRRELLKAAAALPLAQAALTGAASAQGAWPARTITMIVPFPAGGQADLAARPVAGGRGKILRQSVVVGKL